MKLCECGCGNPAPVAKRNRKYLGYLKGGSLHFIQGHRTRTIGGNPNRIPRLCECGCEGVTNIATLTDTSMGRVKGEYQRFIQGHHPRGRPNDYWKRATNAEKNEHIRKVMNSCRIHPNKPELSFMGILDRFYPKQWKYVGDGQVIIGGKNPDFININGHKALIEIYGEYWHRTHNPNDRINFFKRYGFDTLVLWTKELRNISCLKIKLGRFIKKINCKG